MSTRSVNVETVAVSPCCGNSLRGLVRLVSELQIRRTIKTTTHDASHWGFRFSTTDAKPSGMSVVAYSTSSGIHP